MLKHCSIEFLYLPVVIYLTVHRNLLHVCTHSVNITPSNEEKIQYLVCLIETQIICTLREKKRERTSRDSNLNNYQVLPIKKTQVFLIRRVNTAKYMYSKLFLSLLCSIII